jgi:glucose/arabinose dehydrogenase
LRVNCIARRCVGVWALALAACHDSSAPVIPETSGPPPALIPVDSGYDFSVFVTSPPGDTSRVLVVERGGRILLRKHGVRQDSAFLNLTGLTDSATGEYGVYSIAFHPQYAANRFVYVYYVDHSGGTQVSRFTADLTFDHANPATEHSILHVPQAADAVLYGGLVTFGPDGKFYIAIGDGDADVDTAETSRAQDSSALLGKLLRVDVDAADPYGVPADNPFVGRAGWRTEVWQLGLRNPWRWSFDRRTGDLWIGDVGQHVWEEIDRLPAATAGKNFGWPLMEGDACYRTVCDTAGLVKPVLEYPHNPACAVTGGYVYRGAAYPDLDGVYLYGDYCGGWVRGFKLVNGVPVEAFTPLAAPLVNDNVVSFGEDATGEVYVVMASGRIYRVAPTP